MRTLHFELITGNLYFDVAVPFTADTFHRVLARPDTRNIRVTQDRAYRFTRTAEPDAFILRQS